ncbi:endonuclease domain-containing protein [Catenulispora yoronensis]
MSCIIHLTAAERADLTAARARHQRVMDDRRATPREPACWAWPVPEDSLGDARAAMASAAAKFGDIGARAVALYSDDDATWDALVRWHDHRCAACGHPNGAEVRDHDHATGLIRGLLCRSCNALEGHGNDHHFALYRQRPPSVILGVEIRYYSPFTGYAEPQSPEAGERLEASPIHTLASKLAG